MDGQLTLPSPVTVVVSSSDFPHKSRTPVSGQLSFREEKRKKRKTPLQQIGGSTELHDSAPKPHQR